MENDEGKLENKACESLVGIVGFVGMRGDLEPREIF